MDNMWFPESQTEDLAFINGSEKDQWGMREFCLHCVCGWGALLCNELTIFLEDNLFSFARQPQKLWKTRIYLQNLIHQVWEAEVSVR